MTELEQVRAELAAANERIEELQAERMREITRERDHEREKDLFACSIIASGVSQRDLNSFEIAERSVTIYNKIKRALIELNT